MKSLRKLIALVLLMPPATVTLAAESEQPRYNVVEFQAEAQREVPNDLFNATLYVELNDADAAAIADAINKRVNDALRVAKEHKSVRARSGNNQTYPVYSKNKLQSWRGRAEIRIESKDFNAASALIGKLQSSMQLAGMSFSVSPESRRAVQDELSVDAIKAFKTRADILRTALAGKRYKLVRLDVSTGHAGPQPHIAIRGLAQEAVTAPNLESGVSLITVVARGTIEIVD